MVFICIYLWLLVASWNYLNLCGLVQMCTFCPVRRWAYGQWCSHIKSRRSSPSPTPVHKGSYIQVQLWKSKSVFKSLVRLSSNKIERHSVNVWSWHNVNSPNIQQCLRTSLCWPTQSSVRWFMFKLQCELDAKSSPSTTVANSTPSPSLFCSDAKSKSNSIKIGLEAHNYRLHHCLWPLPVLLRVLLA